jgi:hypothetical protein
VISLAGPSLHPRTRLLLNGLLLLFVSGAALFWFWAYLQASGLGPDRPQLFNDATTYLAAAERLNVGHPLYELSPGDRPVLTIPGVYEAPLLSPPPIAALWRFIAALPFGYAAWMVGAWVATWIALAYVVIRAPFPAIPLAFLLSLPIGEQVFGGNACAYYPLLYVLAWRYRDRAWIGVLVAMMAAIKLAPIGMAAWLIGTRRYRAVLITAMSLLAMFLFGAVFAGPGSYVDYLGMLGTVGVSPMSVAGLTGLPWASYVLFAFGSGLAIVVGRRSTSWSYVIALLASVFGTPALYPGHLASLLGLVAPLTERHGATRAEDRGFSVTPRTHRVFGWAGRAR